MRRERGMTLVEITIVVAIIALFSAVAVTSLGNIGRADLKSAASKMAALVRSTYDDAALTGQTKRLVLDPAQKTIKEETTNETLALDPETNVLAQSAKAKDDLKDYLDVPPDMKALFEPPEGTDSSSPADANPMSALGAMFNIGSLAQGGMSTDGEAFQATEGAAFELPDEVKLLDVWLQGMNEPNAKSATYLYFFPNGFTQDALIRLTSEDGCFTVKVAALTGKTSIEAECLEPSK